jgi:choline/glycine/proline betaine transport protein
MKRNPFWIGCEWTGVFTSAITIIIIALTLMFKQGAEELQLRILLQIRRVGFYIKCKYFLIFMIYLAFSKFGQLRIGQSAKPEFKTFLVCNVIQCGMGIGLLFWSISEPIYHFSPPMAEGGTAEAAKEAMKFTFLHWGFHAWAVYALVGLSLLHVFSRTSTYY